MEDVDDEQRYQAAVSKDPRFDGVFFIAVTSTGIYCRPICPSRYAKRANVRFFGSPAAAEAAGFRPCLRCRPEAAPGTPAWLGTAAVVRRALRLINEGALDEESVEALAAFVYSGAHRQVLRRRRRWFERMAEAYAALWWIPRGQLPTTEQAEVRVLHLREVGPTPYAFTLREHFPPPDQADAGPVLSPQEWTCPA